MKGNNAAACVLRAILKLTRIALYSYLFIANSKDRDALKCRKILFAS